jgi:hypothetical protein
MVLTSEEESLVQTVRLLSPEEARKIFHWAAKLNELSRGRAIEWSDAWSDEDVRDASRASQADFEQQEQ